MGRIESRNIDNGLVTPCNGSIPNCHDPVSVFCLLLFWFHSLWSQSYVHVLKIMGPWWLAYGYMIFLSSVFSSHWIHIYICLTLYLSRVFWLNIAKKEVYWCYKYCSKLFGKMRKEIEFRQQYYRNCKKKYNVSGERENWISVLRLPKFLSCPSSRECPKEKTIVATKLLKL